MGSRSASIEIVLDMETIQASFLCIDAYTVKESILQTPRMKLKEHVRYAQLGFYLTSNSSKINHTLHVPAEHHGFKSQKAGSHPSS